MHPEHVREDIIAAMHTLNARHDITGAKRVMRPPSTSTLKPSKQTKLIKGLRTTLMVENNEKTGKKFRKDMADMATMYTGGKSLTLLKQQQVLQIWETKVSKLFWYKAHPNLLVPERNPELGHRSPNPARLYHSYADPQQDTRPYRQWSRSSARQSTTPSKGRQFQVSQFSYRSLSLVTHYPA
jgi:hypothetical protein